MCLEMNALIGTASRLSGVLKRCVVDQDCAMRWTRRGAVFGCRGSVFDAPCPLTVGGFLLRFALGVASQIAFAPAAGVSMACVGFSLI